MLGQINQTFAESELAYRRERLTAAGVRAWHPWHPEADGRLARLAAAVREHVPGRNGHENGRITTRGAGLTSMDHYRAVPAHGRCR